ncbi:MAG TPA: hypothetical protein VFT82_03300 [Candidatus Paceibacterota bacterium]|nr:hypothetical protein [Candidatus Paceibacterota bacterium]
MYPNLTALTEALARLGESYSHVPGFPDSVMAKQGAFIRAATPWNPESVSALTHDKAAVYALLEGKAPFPKTLVFFDPEGDHPEFAREKSVREIAETISPLPYPRTIKMNRGEAGSHVYFVENDDETVCAFAAIFDKKGRNYDFMALVQEHIAVAHEWRVAVAVKVPVFAYAKGTFDIAGDNLYARLSPIATAAIEATGLVWGAIDIIESKEGDLYFLEANSRPSYAGFIGKHGTEKITALYERSLRSAALSKNKMKGSEDPFMTSSQRAKARNGQA